MPENTLSMSEEDVSRIARKVAEAVVEEYDKQLSEFITRKIQTAFADLNNEMERRSKVFKAEITKAVAEYDRDIRRDIRADILAELSKRLDPELERLG